MSRFLCPALLLLIFAPAQGAEVPQHGRYETTVEATNDKAPETFGVTFTSPAGKEFHSLGYWNGGKECRIRFMPTSVGEWKWKTAAPLTPKEGSFVCGANPSKDRFSLHGPIKVARAGTYLEHIDGTPFFFLGDTAWTGTALSTKKDWETYLQNRVEKKFSAVQFVPLCPWRAAPTDIHGKVAFSGKKNITLNPEFFAQVDERMDSLNQAGLLALPVLIWANKATDPGNELPEEDIVRLVRYQLARYGSHHLIWVLAGDNQYQDKDAEKWKRIGRLVFGDAPRFPVTTHPTGMNWPWEEWRNEKWLTVFGYQSGHGDDDTSLKWIHSGPVSKNWQLPANRPVINLEPPYEDHNGYQSKKPHTAYSVRRAIYWSLLSAPLAGVTYGGHGVWSWHTKPDEPPTDHPSTGNAKTWDKALDLPGAGQMKHLAELFASLEWWKLRPTQALIVEPVNLPVSKFISAAQSEDRSLIVVYLPTSVPVTIAGDLKESRGQWFDPRTGTKSEAKGVDGKFTPPADGEDWVLILKKTG